MHRVFSTHYKLTCKFKNLRKRTSSATMCNSRIYKSFLGQAGILVGKWLTIKEKRSSGLCSQGCISQAQARLLTRFVTPQRRHYKFSRDTKIIKNQHWELHQPCVRKSTKVRKVLLEIWHIFPPGGPSLLTKSSQLTTSWSVRLEL